MFGGGVVLGRLIDIRHGEDDRAVIVDTFDHAGLALEVAQGVVHVGEGQAEVLLERGDLVAERGHVGHDDDDMRPRGRLVKSGREVRGQRRPGRGP